MVNNVILRMLVYRVKQEEECKYEREGNACEHGNKCVFLSRLIFDVQTQTER